MEKVIVASNRSFSPFLMWDAAVSKFRLWWNEGPMGAVKFMHSDSPDAITWSTPQVLRADNGYGTTVVKDGPLYYSAYYVEGTGIPDGLRAMQSSDGLNWQLMSQCPLPLIQREYGHDIADLWRHPDGSFHLFTKNHYLNGEPPAFLTVRVTYHSRSTDMINWTMNRDSFGNPEPVFKPDAADSGKTEFYGAAGPVLVNGILVFFLRVLRDDLNQGKGIGYTVLAFSRGDGTCFIRSRKPWTAFLDEPWAHAWVYGACVKDETLFVSYAAYEEGHKQGNRHVVVARMSVSELKLPASLLW